MAENKVESQEKSTALAVHPSSPSFEFVMVLADLGRKLNAALSSLNRASGVDEKVHRPLHVL